MQCPNYRCAKWAECFNTYRLSKSNLGHVLIYHPLLSEWHSIIDVLNKPSFHIVGLYCVTELKKIVNE